MLYTHPRPFKIFGREAKMLWDGTAAEVQQTTGNISQKKTKTKKKDMRAVSGTELANSRET